MTRSTALATAVSSLLLGACALLPPEPLGPPAKETIVAVDANGRLLRFNAGQPQKLLDSRPISGLQPGERVLGIDYRVARGELFALGSSHRLYRLDAATGVATAVGAAFVAPLAGGEFGFDFNPAVDRIRVVGDGGLNMRLHPDTGAVVDADPKTDGLQTDGQLAYDAADLNAGRTPKVVAAAYTYNQQDEKITTNYAIDATLGVLVTQGSIEGTKPPVSPNTGRLFTVGPLGAGAFERAGFDISDVKNVAYAALTAAGGTASRWVRIDLTTGQATRLGTVAGGAPIVGVAIQP